MPHSQGLSWRRACSCSAFLAVSLAGPVEDFQEVIDDPWPGWIKALEAPRPSTTSTKPAIPLHSWMGPTKTTSSTNPPPGWSEDCEYVMGLERRVKRPDMPHYSEIKTSWPKDSLAVQLSYSSSGLSPVDFEMDIDDGGIIAWPRAGFGPTLTVSQADQGGDDMPAREFWLHALQLRMPSEHTINGTRFHGELQLLHRDERGDGVTLSFFLEHAPKYTTGFYPGGCPSAYLAIENEVKCEDAALDMKILHNTRDAERSIVDFSNANARHRVSGCFAVKQENATSPWRLTLDPQVMDLHFAHAAEPLCEFGGRTVMDWFEDLARLSTLPGGVLSCTGPERYLNYKCIKESLTPAQLIKKEQRAMHYSADRTANLPACSVSVEWFIIPEPLPVRIEQLVLAKAAYQTLIGQVLGMAEEMNLTHAGKVPKDDWKGNADVDFVTILPPDKFFRSQASYERLYVLCANFFTVFCFLAAVLLTGLTFRFKGDYEPDLCAMTGRVAWPLVFEQAFIAVASLSSIPVFCAQVRFKTNATAPPGGFLPWGCQIHLSAIILMHICAELYFFNCTGAAGRRVNLCEGCIFIVLDALAVFDLYTDILFFVVTYLVGSPYCWSVLWVWVGGFVVMQWFVGALCCISSPDQPLVHWYPRHMSLLHAVNLRQLHHMQRWDLIRGLWVLIPLLKVFCEDIPQVVLQYLFGWRHNGDATLVVIVSASSSLFFAIGGLITTTEQAVSLGIGVHELKDIVLERCGCQEPKSRPLMPTKRGPWDDPLPPGGVLDDDEEEMEFQTRLPPSRMSLITITPPTALASVYHEYADPADIEALRFLTEPDSPATGVFAKARQSVGALQVGHLVSKAREQAGRLSLPGRLRASSASSPGEALSDPLVLTTMPPGSSPIAQVFSPPPEPEKSPPPPPIIEIFVPPNRNKKKPPAKKANGKKPALD